MEPVIVLKNVQLVEESNQELVLEDMECVAHVSISINKYEKYSHSNNFGFSSKRLWRHLIRKLHLFSIKWNRSWSMQIEDLPM